VFAVLASRNIHGNVSHGFDLIRYLLVALISYFSVTRQPAWSLWFYSFTYKLKIHVWLTVLFKLLLINTIYLIVFSERSGFDSIQ
jgi:hypothetical protein